jgi:hypothetical protein
MQSSGAARGLTRIGANKSPQLQMSDLAEKSFQEKHSSLIFMNMSDEKIVTHLTSVLL